MLTTKIGWEGSTPTAGDVNVAPATQAPTFGSRSAYNMHSCEYW
jgi:hypothetical protein